MWAVAVLITKSVHSLLMAVRRQTRILQALKKQMREGLWLVDSTSVLVLSRVGARLYQSMHTSQPQESIGYLLERLSTVTEVQSSKDQAILCLLARLHPALPQDSPFRIKGIANLATILSCESRKTHDESMLSRRACESAEGLVV